MLEKWSRRYFWDQNYIQRSRRVIITSSFSSFANFISNIILIFMPRHFWMCLCRHSTLKGTPATQLNRCDHPVPFTPLNTAIKNSVTWCSNSNHLLPNTTKTMEMVVDFRRPRPHLELVVTKGDSVEVVDPFEHLGVQLDDWLDRQHRRSVQERICLLLFLRRLASFIIWRKLRQIFYQR